MENKAQDISVGGQVYRTSEELEIGSKDLAGWLWSPMLLNTVLYHATNRILKNLFTQESYNVIRSASSQSQWPVEELRYI